MKEYILDYEKISGIFRNCIRSTLSSKLDEESLLEAYNKCKETIYRIIKNKLAILDNNCDYIAYLDSVYNTIKEYNYDFHRGITVTDFQFIQSYKQKIS